MELTFDMNEMMTHVVNVDFGDGAGKVPAHQHVMSVLMLWFLVMLE